jgi:hypothetical protein
MREPMLIGLLRQLLSGKRRLAAAHPGVNGARVPLRLFSYSFDPAAPIGGLRIVPVADGSQDGAIYL